MNKFVRTSALVALAVVGFSFSANAEQIIYSNGMITQVAYQPTYVAPTYMAAPVSYYETYAAPVTTQVAYVTDGYSQYVPAATVMPVSYYGYNGYGYVDPIWHY